MDDNELGEKYWKEINRGWPNPLKWGDLYDWQRATYILRAKAAAKKGQKLVEEAQRQQ